MDTTSSPTATMNKDLANQADQTELPTQKRQGIGAESIIETRDLSKSFGPFKALSKCTISVERGEIFGLLGPNGAGKTTLIRLLMGFISPTSGWAKIEGMDCYRKRVQVHRSVAYLPGDARLFRTMTGRGVLKFFSNIRRDADLTRAHDTADRLELDLSRWVAFMSTGMRQKLALAVVMSIDCPLLILDEPTANLDPTVRGEVLDMVCEARDAGKTILLSSHVLSEIEEICDHVAILRTGQLVHFESIHELRQQHRIRGIVRGELPKMEPDLKDQVYVSLKDDKVLIETSDFSRILKWLADAPISDVRVEPVGLRAIYDRFHSKQSVVAKP
jgi:ABC-2 type transport system ATP-binding protein